MRHWPRYALTHLSRLGHYCVIQSSKKRMSGKMRQQVPPKRWETLKGQCGVISEEYILKSPMLLRTQNSCIVYMVQISLDGSRKRAHTRTHTHTHTHSHSHTHAHAHTLTHTHTHKHKHAHSYTQTHTHSLTLTHTHTLTHAKRNPRPNTWIH
jgi:hypothetical protein